MHEAVQHAYVSGGRGGGQPPSLTQPGQVQRPSRQDGGKLTAKLHGGSARTHGAKSSPCSSAPCQAGSGSTRLLTPETAQHAAQSQRQDDEQQAGRGRVAVWHTSRSHVKKEKFTMGTP